VGKQGVIRVLNIIELVIIYAGAIAFCGYLAYIYCKYSNKKIPNPAIKKFEENVKKQGFFLVKAGYSHADLSISDSDEFLRFAKSWSNRYTIFKYTDLRCVIYFCIVSGVIVRTTLKLKVKEEKRK